MFESTGVWIDPLGLALLLETLNLPCECEPRNARIDRSYGGEVYRDGVYCKVGDRPLYPRPAKAACRGFHPYPIGDFRRASGDCMDCEAYPECHRPMERWWRQERNAA